MRHSLLEKTVIVILILVACALFFYRNETKLATLKSAQVISNQKTVQFKSPQDAYEARSFFNMVSLMQSEPDTYNMHKQFIPAVGRDKFEYSNGRWKNTRPCASDKVLSNDAVGQILEMTKKARLVIINEAHDIPQHREFIAHLLPGLAKQGFNIYGAETFSLANSSFSDWKTDVEINGFEAVSGFYLSEPTFSRLVKKALDLGFRLVPYEFEGNTPQGLSISERIKMREEGQAKNIWERALSQPENKVILHVGYSHVREEVDKMNTSWLASILKYQYGIDPVTISQTNCSVTELSKSWSFSVPHKDLGIDLSIHSFPEELMNKRPNWYDLLGYKRYSANNFVSGEFAAAIVEAIDREDKSIADRVYFRRGESIDLVLKPGKYMIYVAFDDSNTTLIKEIEVK